MEWTPVGTPLASRGAFSHLAHRLPRELLGYKPHGRLGYGGGRLAQDDLQRLSTTGGAASLWFSGHREIATHVRGSDEPEHS